MANKKKKVPIKKTKKTKPLVKATSPKKQKPTLPKTFDVFSLNRHDRSVILLSLFFILFGGGIISMYFIMGESLFAIMPDDIIYMLAPFALIFAAVLSLIGIILLLAYSIRYSRRSALIRQPLCYSTSNKGKLAASFLVPTIIFISFPIFGLCSNKVFPITYLKNQCLVPIREVKQGTCVDNCRFDLNPSNLLTEYHKILDSTTPGNSPIMTELVNSINFILSYFSTSGPLSATAVSNYSYGHPEFRLCYHFYVPIKISYLDKEICQLEYIFWMQEGTKVTENSSEDIKNNLETRAILDPSTYNGPVTLSPADSFMTIPHDDTTLSRYCWKEGDAEGCFKTTEFTPDGYLNFLSRKNQTYDFLWKINHFLWVKKDEHHIFARDFNSIPTDYQFVFLYNGEPHTPK